MGIYHLRAIIKVDKFFEADTEIDRKICDRNYAINQKEILLEQQKEKI